MILIPLGFVFDDNFGDPNQAFLRHLFLKKSSRNFFKVFRKIGEKYLEVSYQ